ncbi:NAC domain-containing protein 35-like isoform X2 [Amaranthus tricolor]|uniref:NAC domain-containing protein 35-like isoform X2 n=1 Tax=Amaranthus tricolor TaxID=29722 RepID=UPI00258B215B|nr:NAC domain-containing protein 35-like isoform X2 [Amaranthus tricolor]
MGVLEYMIHFEASIINLSFSLAAIGEKEWFFYVPRDRKYRNGDRPNRVTTSGYWKATGADRMIRGDQNRAIGLKKTLVFYSGKAPKGIRSSWIMNEYRLPHHDTQRYQKVEISLCRVYKRAGVEDHPSIRNGNLQSKLSNSSKTTSYSTAFRVQTTYLQQQMEKVSETDASSSTEVGTTAISPLALQHSLTPPPPQSDLQPQQRSGCSVSVGGSGRSGEVEVSHGVITPLPISTSSVEDIQRLVEYQQVCFNQYFQQQQHQQQQIQFESPNNSNLPFLFSNYLFSPAQAALINNTSLPVPGPPPMAVGSESTNLQLPSASALWDWSTYSETNTRDQFGNLFK